MNIKKEYEKIFNFFKNLHTLLKNNSTGFEICKTIDLNERIDFLDYEDRLLIYGVGARPSKLLGSNLKYPKVNVRGLLEHVKKEGLKYGRSPIPVYKEGIYKKKIKDNYLWIMNNLKFLSDIFKIRIENYEAKENGIQSSLADYQKYLYEEGVKINKDKIGLKTIHCPYCFKKIPSESVICSFCGSIISDTNG